MDMPDFGERLGPLPLGAWVVLGGGGLALLVFLRGGGSQELPPQLLAPGTADNGSGLTAEEIQARINTAVQANRATDNAALTQQLAAIQSQYNQTLADRLAGLSTNFSAQIAQILARLNGSAPNAGTPIPEPIGNSGGGSGGGTLPGMQPGGRYADQPLWWRKGLEWFQSRSILFGWSSDTQARTIPELIKSIRDGFDEIGGRYNAGKLVGQFLLPVGLDTGYGFKIPYAYDGGRDTFKTFEGETAWRRVWRRWADFMEQHPNANPAEVFKLQVRRVAGEALNDAAQQGISREEAIRRIGFVLPNLADAYESSEIGQLRADEALAARGLQV